MVVDTKLKMKLEKSYNKPKSKNPTWLGSVTKRLRLKKNKHPFLLNNNDIPLIEIGKIQSYAKSALNKELSQQQYNGLIYTNIAKIR